MQNHTVPQNLEANDQVIDLWMLEANDQAIGLVKKAELLIIIFI